jgi:hypothetical protein
MPTYYVRPDGNDLNVGTAPTNAAGTGSFRTVNKALSVAVGGDTVWIAPGTYRENVYPTTAAQNTYIYVKGDPTLTQVPWGSGLTVGVIRLTNQLTNDSSTPSGVTLDLGTNYATLRRFYDFSKIRIDGSFRCVAFWDTTDNTRGSGHRFTDCQFAGNGQLTEFFGYSNLGDRYVWNIEFLRCTFSNVPMRFGRAQLNVSVDERLSFVDCLFYVCESPAVLGTFYWSMEAGAGAQGTTHVRFFNCTVLPGRTTPSYIWNDNVGGTTGNFIVINCLILATATTATFRSVASGIVENYNYGINITRSSVASGANSVTLQYAPIDINDGYSQGVFNYVPHTPLPASPVIGAGTQSVTVGTTTWTTPTTDFSNNLWNQLNPTVGYMDNRVIATVPGAGGYVPLDRSIQTVTVTAAETGKSVHVYLGSTGVTFQTPNLTCYYARNNGTSVNIPLVAGNASTWVSGSLYEVSAVTMPGVYKFDIPNEVISSGASTASIMLRGANAFNGAYVNINIKQPAQSAYLSTTGYKLLSEYAGSDGVLTVNKGTVTTIKCQIADTNGTAVNIGSSTMSVEVYSSANVLIGSYTPTVQYASNGAVTFVIDGTVTNTAGNYNVYAIRAGGTTDRAVFGPLAVKVNNL